MVFFFNDTATTEIYPPSLHDALPILLTLAFVLALAVFVLVFVLLALVLVFRAAPPVLRFAVVFSEVIQRTDRKSTRLNSSHANISYAVFCLKNKNSSV